MTIINPDGSETEIPDTSTLARAYNALSIAADRMGKNGHITRFKSKRKSNRFAPTAEHVAIIEAMPKLLAGEISPEEAMGMLHDYDVLKQRLG